MLRVRGDSLASAYGWCRVSCALFFFNDTATTEIYTLSLHDALPISIWSHEILNRGALFEELRVAAERSEEHTSELQSPNNLVCRLLLEKNKKCVMFSCAVSTPRLSLPLLLWTCTV